MQQKKQKNKPKPKHNTTLGHIEKDLAKSLADIVDARSRSTVAYNVGRTQSLADLCQENGYDIFVYVRLVKKG